MIWHILTADNKSASAPKVLCGRTGFDQGNMTTRADLVGNGAVRKNSVCADCEKLMGDNLLALIDTPEKLGQAVESSFVTLPVLVPVKKTRARKKKNG